MNKFIVVLLVVIIVLQGVLLNRLMTTEADMGLLKERIVLTATAAEMAALKEQAVLQSAAIQVGLRNVVPLVLPGSIEEEIMSIEKQLKAQPHWPKTMEEIQQLSDRLAGVVKKLPTWAQEELLPRLLPRRWEIEALWMLADSPSADGESLAVYASEIELHISNKPVDSSDEIGVLLRQKMQKVKAEMPKAERMAAIEVGRRAVETKQNLEDAARTLAAYEDEDARAVSMMLSEIIRKRNFDHEMAFIESDIERSRKFSDASLREYAMVRANQAVMDLRLRILSSGVRDSQIDGKLNGVEKKALSEIKAAGVARQRLNAEKLKEYQRWALNEIKQVRSLRYLEDIKGDKSKALRLLIDDMVNHMAPIDQALLEPAVSQWFGKVYQKRFEEIPLEKDQLEVITKFATANKRALD